MLKWLVIGPGDIATRRVLPAVLAEPRSKLARLGIEARYVRSLVTIAMSTGQRQVPLSRLATMFLGTHMVNLKGQRECGLRKTAVLTTLTCPLPHVQRELAIHLRLAGLCLLQQPPCLGLHDSKEAAHVQVAVELLAFGIR